MKQRKLVPQIVVILNKLGGILSEILLAIEFLKKVMRSPGHFQYFETTTVQTTFAYARIDAIANLSWSEVPRNE